MGCYETCSARPPALAFCFRLGTCAPRQLHPLAASFSLSLCPFIFSPSHDSRTEFFVHFPPLFLSLWLCCSSLALRMDSQRRLTFYPSQGNGTPAPTAETLLTSLSWVHRASILHLSFPDTCYVTTPLGVVFDRDYGTALWVAIRILKENLEITPDIVAFAQAHGLPNVPKLFSFPFYPGVNVLHSLFRDLNEAHELVGMAQRAGQETLEWLVALCRALEHESLRAGNALPPHTSHLLDYYRCLEWRNDDAASNACRALVPYRPGPPPPSPSFPTPFSGSGAAYHPSDPYLLPYPNGSAPFPTAAPVSSAPSGPAGTHAELLRLYRSLLGQEGVSGLDTAQLAASAAQLAAEEAARPTDAIVLTPGDSSDDPTFSARAAGPEVIEVD